ncbi:MAG: GNAT family N-acetyltransferase [Bryobacterales bacterium]|nr:GNAT family N-acetyltransferase [Bryobacterales bacterium]
MSVEVRRAGIRDVEWCARTMAASDPWLTLGIGEQRLRKAVAAADRELYVAEREGAPAGFILLCLAGPFTGYIQAICVHPDHRNEGIGRRLIAYAEERIFRDSPNVFLCVSSFNGGARRLYERLGYEVIGEMKDYLARGHGELLMRKSRGPWKEFWAE